jgi:DNA repair exonuclease SbcCD ATPase subunit
LDGLREPENRFFYWRRFLVEITKEWLEEQIEKLERELKEAESREAGARMWFGRAEAEYNAAMESVETTAGVLEGLKVELAFMNATAK